MNSEVLQQLSDKIDNLFSLCKQIKDKDGGETYVTTIEDGLNYIKSRIASANTTLTSKSDADKFNGSINNFQTDAKAFISNGNVEHLKTIIESHLSALLSLSEHRIHVFESVDEIIGFADAISETVLRVQARAASFRDAVANQQADLDKKFTELSRKDKNFGNALKELEEKIETDKARLFDVIEEMRVEFRNNEKERAKKSSEVFEAINKEWNETLFAHKEAFKNIIEKDATQFLKDMEEERDRIKGLGHLIAGAGMASGFEQTAEDERIEADGLRKYSIIAWSLAALASLVLIGASFFFETTIGSVLGRSVLILLLIAPATYLTKEANAHRRESRRARRYALEMAALESYFAPLSLEEKKAMIITLSQKYFGHVENVLGGDDNITAYQQLIDRVLVMTGRKDEALKK